MARMATFTCLIAAAAAAGCGSDRPSRGEGTVEVVATIGPLADLVANAGGRRVHVTRLVPAGGDPHAWRLSPAAREAIDRADLVVRSGGAVDAWVEGAGSGRELTLLPLVQPLAGDPHWWQDPVRAQRAAKEVRNELARADVDGAGYYEAATADLLARLRKLDRGIRRCLARVPRPRPRLAAQHAGFAYFSERYGVAITGPRGRGARAGRRLWADTLGRPGTKEASYLGAMAANAAAIVDGISGGKASCRLRP
jgi:ABC-type Zn uptake system ZnuABC Zn-binding protein ZnuA